MSDSPSKPPIKLKWIDQDHDRYRKSTKQEDRIAALVGGKRLKRSGGMYWSGRWDGGTEGGDVVSPEFVIEHKRTRRQGYTLKVDTLDKVREGAQRKSRDAALVITFERGRALDDWVVVPLKTLLRLLGREGL